MQFSEAEVRFLLQPHRIETAAGHGREMKSAVDMRQLGCPEKMFRKVLEDRARRLGSRFSEFRAMNMARPAPADDLDARVQGSSLF